MSDRYGELVQSAIGRKVAKNLGLPMPVKLDRYEVGQPILRGELALGLSLGEDKSCQNALAEILTKLSAKVACNQDFTGKASTLDERLTDENARFKVAIFDATNIKSSDELKQVYEFFHAIARKIKSSGRVIILARPDCCTGTDVNFALAQRALLGFIKSVAKEFKKGITAQVLYVKKGAEGELEHSLNFFMSAKSAYVSGQSVVIGQSKQADKTQTLQGKKILVTGASRGIGLAIAQVLARDGAKVYCLDVPQSLADLQRVAGQIGGFALPLDITAEDAGEQIAKACGVLDGLVHNAGVTRDKTLANMSEDKWDLVMNINLAAIARINDYLLSHDGLSQEARIVCVSSISGIAGNLGQTNYAMSKAGVIGLVQATAKLFADSARTINAVAPGFIETKMTGQIPFAIREAGRRMNAMSQGGEPVDVAETIAWLLSPQAGGLNGNIVRVCGQSLLGA